jgi:glycylpeptide N-tetradecanoyltransferase
METNPSESENQPKEQTPVEEPKVQELSEEGVAETTAVDSSQEETKDKQSSEDQKKMVLDLMEKVQAMGGDPKNPKNQAALKEFQKYKTLYEKHEFWDTQPVPKVAGKMEEGEIEKGKLDEVREEPYGLPEGFTWSDVDLENEEQLHEVYELLRDHYVEDSDHMFRFDYQKEFLKWALLPPKQFSDWVCGVRGGKKNKLFGFITGIPVKLRIKGKMVKMTEINFLCVHKKIRKHRLAPVLIKEITRRTHQKNLWQAIYTAGIVIPTPVTECTYYHRNLNTKKLLEIGFSSLPQGRPKSLHIKLLKVPNETTIEGIRPMEKRDVKQVQVLLDEYLQKFNLSFHFNKEEVSHFFLPRKNVIYSYVVVDPESNEITDFISYYSLPSTIIGDEKYKTLYAAFCYYMVPKKHSIQEIMKNALILARNDKFDVFNALDIMDNRESFDDLHFGVGNGNLYYYLYNWKLDKIQSDKVGIVLV